MGLNINYVKRDFYYKNMKAQLYLNYYKNCQTFSIHI